MLKKSCDICNINFDYYYELNRHIQNHHAKLFKRKRQYQCNICNKSYYDYASLRSHKTKRHPKKKAVNVTVTCNQCCKEFLSEFNFKRHLLVHSIKDRTCRFCHCDFKNKDSLEGHFLEDHPHEKIYRCDYCNFDITSYNEMMKHRKLQSHKKKFRSFLRFHWQLFMKSRIDKNTENSEETIIILIKEETDVTIKTEPTDFGDCDNLEPLDLEFKPQSRIS